MYIVWCFVYNIYSSRHISTFPHDLVFEKKLFLATRKCGGGNFLYNLIFILFFFEENKNKSFLSQKICWKKKRLKLFLKENDRKTTFFLAFVCGKTFYAKKKPQAFSFLHYFYLFQKEILCSHAVTLNGFPNNKKYSFSDKKKI